MSAQHKHDSERLMTPEDCIAMALSTFVPGPSWKISPSGKGVRVIMLTLKKMGFKIVPMEREDYERSA